MAKIRGACEATGNRTQTTINRAATGFLDVGSLFALAAMVLLTKINIKQNGQSQARTYGAITQLFTQYAPFLIFNDT